MRKIEKLELEFNSGKREICIPELTIGELREYINTFSQSGENFAGTALSILKSIVKISEEEINELTFTDLDELRKTFIKANQVFFRGAGWIGLSSKLEMMIKEVVNGLSLKQ